MKLVLQAKKYILFDLDGTLTDPKPGITASINFALQKLGLPEEDPDALLPFIGPPLRESFAKYYGLTGEHLEYAMQSYREYFGVRGLYENEVYRGIPELLQALNAAGYCLLVATSKPAVYAEPILTHFGLRQYFYVVAGSELDGRRVKKGEVIRYAMESAGVSCPEDAVMIGDREQDIFGAKENRIRNIGVLYGYGSREELTGAGADDVAETIQDLHGFFLPKGGKE